MKILNDLISTLDMEFDVRDIRQGLFYTAVLTRNYGLAATIPRDALRQEIPSIKHSGYMQEKETSELVQMAYSECILEAVIGMATINSLLDIKDKQCTELNAGNLIASKGKDKTVVMVGHFPFIPELRKVIKKLWVIEKNPREGDSVESEMGYLISQADVVGITGIAFTNHTIERLLELCNSKTYVVVLGGTAPLSPVVFDYDIDAISDTKVIDPQLALRCVSEGATYHQIKGIRQLTLTYESLYKYKYRGLV